jgi:hypothetical protein
MNKSIKLSTLGLLIIIFFAGIIVTYIYLEPQLSYKGKSAQVWAALDTKDMNSYNAESQQLSNLNKKYASVSAALQALLNAPTPTPIIQIQNVSPSHPDMSSCTLEGNFYFCPANNCYYNPNGTPTGECKIPPL